MKPGKKKSWLHMKPKKKSHQVVIGFMGIDEKKFFFNFHNLMKIKS